jgi:hypothetical protein
LPTWSRFVRDVVVVACVIQIEIMTQYPCLKFDTSPFFSFSRKEKDEGLKNRYMYGTLSNSTRRNGICLLTEEEDPITMNLAGADTEGSDRGHKRRRHQNEELPPPPPPMQASPQFLPPPPVILVPGPPPMIPAAQNPYSPQMYGAQFPAPIMYGPGQPPPQPFFMQQPAPQQMMAAFPAPPPPQLYQTAARQSYVGQNPSQPPQNAQEEEEQISSTSDADDHNSTHHGSGGTATSDDVVMAEDALNDSEEEEEEGEEGESQAEERNSSADETSSSSSEHDSAAKEDELEESSSDNESSSSSSSSSEEEKEIKGKRLQNKFDEEVSTSEKEAIKLLRESTRDENNANNDDGSNSDRSELARNRTTSMQERVHANEKERVETVSRTNDEIQVLFNRILLLKLSGDDDAQARSLVNQSLENLVDQLKLDRDLVLEKFPTDLILRIADFLDNRKLWNTVLSLCRELREKGRTLMPRLWPEKTSFRVWPDIISILNYGLSVDSSHLVWTKKKSTDMEGTPIKQCHIKDGPQKDQIVRRRQKVAESYSSLSPDCRKIALYTQDGRNSTVEMRHLTKCGSVLSHEPTLDFDLRKVSDPWMVEFSPNSEYLLVCGGAENNNGHFQEMLTVWNLGQQSCIFSDFLLRRNSNATVCFGDKVVFLSYGDGRLSPMTAVVINFRLPSPVSATLGRIEGPTMATNFRICPTDESLLCFSAYDGHAFAGDLRVLFMLRLRNSKSQANIPIEGFDSMDLLTSTHPTPEASHFEWYPDGKYVVVMLVRTLKLVGVRLDPDSGNVVFDDSSLPTDSLPSRLVSKANRTLKDRFGESYHLRKIVISKDCRTIAIHLGVLGMGLHFESESIHVVSV